MGNRDVSAAWRYHNATKHSYWSVRDGHGLDWPNQPIPFKLYKDAEGLRLPHDGQPVTATVSQALNGLAPEVGSLDSATLARLLYMSAGITKKKPYTGGEIYFRAAACTGALYHIDLYVVCGDIPGLEAGVYHFGPHDFALTTLRKGDFRGALAEASGSDESVASAPATIVLADTHWRNSWKYGARAYRHTFWDSGTLLANALAMTNGFGLPAKVVTCFADAQVHRLLGLEEEKESVVALLPLGQGSGVEPGSAPPLHDLHMPTEPLSPKMVEQPDIYEMNSASSLDSGEGAAALRASAATLASTTPVPLDVLLPLPEAVDVERGLEETIVHRGSTRRFARDPITLPQLSAALRLATGGIASDFSATDGTLLNDIFLIVNSVEGLTAGAYRYDPGAHALESLKQGDFRDEAGFLGLEQSIPADASVNVYMLADLNRALAAFGNRGYRMAQLEAGIIGGRLYLAAYGLKFGASGLTFYDDEVVKFFGPRAEGLDVMFLMALGRSVKLKGARLPTSG